MQNRALFSAFTTSELKHVEQDVTNFKYTEFYDHLRQPSYGFHLSTEVYIFKDRKALIISVNQHEE